MLPKIAVPTFEMKLPSTDERILYRPFLVKEEKVLLIAKQSGERVDIINAIKQVISACVLSDNFNIERITVFDMEYLFIKIRSISVGNEIEFSVTDSTDETTYDFKLNLDEVEVTFPENASKEILLTDDIGIMMKYPTMDLSEKIASMDDILDIAEETVKSCIDYAFDKETTYPWNDESQEDKDEFFNSLNQSQYEKITDFFQRVPKIEHIFEYTNAKGEDKKVYFRKIEDFFLLG